MTVSTSTVSLSDLAKFAARDAGFDLCGVAPISDFSELEYFSDWIEAGHAGEMEYLESRTDSGELKRASISNTAPWARSIVVCGMNYDSEHPYSTEVAGDKSRGWIARYAWSRDYHDAVMERLRRVEATLRNASSEELTTRCYVDTGPHVERIYAKYAGIGWIGKNTCIINHEIGSWFFLGIVLTSASLAPDAQAADRCGSCTRCIEACPTDALIAPYQMDASRCVSYLTIEKRGAIPEDFRGGIGNNVFGCDICQDVCPWNRKQSEAHTRSSVPELQPRPELVNPALDWLAEMTQDEFQQTFRRSPIKRAKLSGLRRNAIIAMGNSGDAKFRPVLERCQCDEDPVLREHAAWALKQLDKRH